MLSFILSIVYGAIAGWIASKIMNCLLYTSIINLYTGFRQVDEEKIKLIYTLGGNRRTTLFKVVLPGSVPIYLHRAEYNRNGSGQDHFK